MDTGQLYIHTYKQSGTGILPVTVAARPQRLVTALQRPDPEVVRCWRWCADALEGLQSAVLQRSDPVVVRGRRGGADALEGLQGRYYSGPTR